MRTQSNNKIMTGRNKGLELKAPTVIDIKNTQKLFCDFGVKADIPDFATKRELYNWRDRIIRGFL